MRNGRAWVWLILAVCVVGGAWLRLDGLGNRTMGHTEIFVPGVDLPSDHGEPRGRLTLSRTVTNSLWEPHPPGWYVAMWFWVKAFGVSLFAIRLPSVLFGLGCVLLVYRLAVQEGSRARGLIAAAFLAFHGHQIYWAQIARPSTNIEFLGLLATVLLFSLARGGRRATAIGYAAVSVIGLAFDYYFWLLFLAHILWALYDGWRDRSRALALLRLQMLAVCLAAPMVTLSIFQSRAAHFEKDLVNDLTDFFRLGFLFTGKSPVPHAIPDGIARFLAPLGVGLSLLGLAVSRPRNGKPAGDPPPAPGLGFLGVAAVLMIVVIVGASAAFLRNYVPDKTAVLFGTAALPAATFLVAWLFRTPDAPLSRLWDAVASPLGAGTRPLSLIATMAVVPTALVTGVTLFFPLFVARHMLVFVPYLVLLMAGAVVWLAGRGAGGKLASGAVAGMVAVAAFQSVGWYADRIHSPEDYERLADAWLPELREGDTLLLWDHWSTSPMLYYVNHRKYDLVWENHRDALAGGRGGDRVWRLALAAFPVPEDIAAAVEGRREVQRVEARGIAAVRYARGDAE